VATPLGPAGAGTRTRPAAPRHATPGTQRIILINVQDPTPNTAPTDWVSFYVDPKAARHDYTFWSVFSFGLGLEVLFENILRFFLSHSRHWSLIILVGFLFVYAGVAWCIANKVRRKAIRNAIEELRTKPDLPLAHRVVTSGFVRRYPWCFDADLWIKETGPHGPRTLLLDKTRPVKLQDGTVFEEVDIDAELASTNIRRKRVILPLCTMLALGGWLLSWVGMRHTNALAAVALCLVVLVAVFLQCYGLNPALRRVSIATLGKVEVTSLGRTTTYTREDSVLFVADMSVFTERIDVALIRRDGRTASFSFPDPRDPTLAKLIARWTHPARPTT